MQLIPRGKGEIRSIRFHTIPVILLIGVSLTLFALAIVTSFFLWVRYQEMNAQMNETIITHEQVKLENETYLRENARLKQDFDVLNQDLLKLKQEVEKNQSHLEKLENLGGKSPTGVGRGKERSVAVASLSTDSTPLLTLGSSPIYIEGIRQNLTQLSKEVLLQEKELSSLETRMKAQLEALKRIPMGWPTSGRVTSLFGIRKDPFTKRKKMHEGMDFADGYGTPIHVTAKGRVVSTGWNGPYGNQVVVNHGNGYVTSYSHLSSIDVKVGDNVERGEMVGKMGTTGRSTGVHLHYEVHKNGKPLDPKSFLGGVEVVAQEETTND